jgi:hypothetical protein
MGIVLANRARRKGGWPSHARISLRSCTASRRYCSLQTTARRPTRVASAPRFPSIENFLASEDSDEVATARLVQELTARLKELNVRGKLTADAASQNGRWLRIDIPGNADKRKDLPIRVYIESQPHSPIVQKYPVGAGSAARNVRKAMVSWTVYFAVLVIAQPEVARHPRSGRSCRLSVLMR